MNENLVILKIFSQAVEKYPQRIALQLRRDSQWLRYSYKEVENLSKKIGTFLIRQGIKKNEFVALILENRPEWPIIYFGIISSGATCVPLNPELSPDELEWLLNDCSCRLAFSSRNILQTKLSPKLKSSLKKIIVLDLDKESDNLIDFSKIKSSLSSNISWPEVKPSDIASLIYTSGTTAQAKGVLLSHYNLCSNFKSIERLNLVLPGENFLSILPLYHTYAFMVTLLVPLFSGVTVTYCTSLKSEDIIRTIKEAGVTFLVGVPQLFSLIHRRIFKRIERIPALLRPLLLGFIKIKIRQSFGENFRVMVCGGARLEPKVGYELSRFFRLIEGYGLTETSPVVTFNPIHKPKFGSVGKVIPDVEIKILNPDDSGIGEVLIKGPNVMQGYFKRRNLTSQIIKDGWLYSGDLGYLDKDGYLFLTGRVKDVIVLSSGKNIYPEELQEHYLKIPYIKEICILSRKEERFGQTLESLYAVIVPDLEYFRQKNRVNIKETIRDEINILSKTLPSYAHIMGFTVTKEPLPRTALKKIIRYKVSEQYLKEKISLEELKKTAVTLEDKRLLESEIAKKVINYLTQELKRPIYLDNHLEIDLGIDSLSRVELALGLEGLLKIKIPDEVIYTVSNIKELILNIQNIIKSTTTLITSLPEERGNWSQILSQTPTSSVLNKIRISTGFLDKILTLVFKHIFLIIFRSIWFLKIKGRMNLPPKGPYIICCNHASYLDGFAVFSSLPYRCAINLFFIGQAKIFEHPLVAWTIKVARLISIDPSTYMVKAMQAASFLLRNKKIICIFPEGGRSPSDEIKEFKKGVGILLKELNLPVIPVNIIGSHYSWPVTNKFPKPHPLKIIIGKPCYWQQLGRDYDSIAKELRERIIKLKDVSS